MQGFSNTLITFLLKLLENFMTLNQGNTILYLCLNI